MSKFYMLWCDSWNIGLCYYNFFDFVMQPSSFCKSLTQNEQNILMFIFVNSYEDNNIWSLYLFRNVKVSREGILESHNLWQGLWKEI
jgi:hypothetical protein